MKTKVQASTGSARGSETEAKPEQQSTTMKKPRKTTAQTTDEQLAELLYANNMNLLAAFCESPCAGETAATIAPCIIKLVEYSEMHSRRPTSAPEKFIKRLLKKRIVMFAEKGWDMSDVLRDNSMATLLLNAFIRREGKEYMHKCLEKPIQDALAVIEDCEMDPEKITKELTTAESKPSPEEVRLRLTENERRLKGVVSSIVVSVLEKRHLMPESVRGLCCFLKCAIEDHTSQAGISPTAPKSPEAILVGSLPYESLVAYATASGYPGFSGLSGLAAHSTDMGLVVGSMGRLPEEEASDLNADKQHLQQHQRATLVSESPKTTGDITSSDKETTPPASGSPSSYNPLTLKPRGGFVRTSLENVLSMAKSRSSTNTSRGLSFNTGTTGRLSNGGNGTMNKKMSIDSQARPKLIVYSTFEKVVAAALFLRFFLPAITTPDMNGLCTTPIKARGRRGLVLVGKILQAMCNDVDFGTKDSFLININPFLYEYRDKIRDFLYYASDYSKRDMNALRNTRLSEEEIENIPVPVNQKPKNKLINKLTQRVGNAKSLDQIFSGSRMRELKNDSDDMLARASHPEVDQLGCSMNKPRMGLADMDASVSLEPLFNFMAKHIAKFQEHVESAISFSQLPSDEAEGVLENFEELKLILETSVYSPTVGAVKPQKKSLSKKIKSMFTKVD